MCSPIWFCVADAVLIRGGGSYLVDVFVRLFFM